jgi:hypothetical protein
VLDTAAFAAVAVVLGGVVAVTARDGRIVVLGLMLAAVAAALVASPLPDSLAVTARIVGAMLAAYVLWVAVDSGSVDSAGSAVGLVAEIAVAIAAFVVGLAMRPVDPLAGPVEAQAAALSLVAMAVVPLAGRDVFRMGVGVTLLTLGSSLMVGAWAGPMPALEQLAMAALLVGIAGATSLLVPSAEAGDALEAVAEEAAAEEAARQQAETTELVTVAQRPPAVRPAATRRSGFEAVASPRARAHDQSAPTGSMESERRPKPMTADPIEMDDWLAWGAPEPEPRRASTPTVRPAPLPKPGETHKPAPKKPTTRSRPNLHGKP